jgi:hypothetical protein
MLIQRGRFSSSLKKGSGVPEQSENETSSSLRKLQAQLHREEDKHYEYK